MKILALDQSSKTTGYAIFEDRELVNYGKITFSHSNPIERMNCLMQEIENIIKNNNIEKVFLEDIQMQGRVNNVVTFKILAFVLGMFEIYCFKNKIPYEVIPSSTWKSKCKIKGKARQEQKQDAQRFVKEVFDISPAQDTVDAICLGYSFYL